ncbi:hypothetical protein [Roseivivax sp. THAF40]|uniref:hypothetical protein n=1 Tax=Roseivivax sp. THAF40 TaxID=2587858 RepID=UPI001561DB99|nr:hypothetical protein [Roseivivax sp. THAF40]
MTAKTPGSLGKRARFGLVAKHGKAVSRQIVLVLAQHGLERRCPRLGQTDMEKDLLF